MITINTPSQFSDYIDQEIIFPDNIRFGKADLKHFLRLSQDQTDIHNPEITEQPVIPGNMILMMMPRFIQQMIRVEEIQSVMTVSYDKISFKSPLHIDQEFKLSLTCTNLRKRGETYFLSQEVKLKHPADGMIFCQIQINDLYR